MNRRLVLLPLLVGSPLLLLLFYAADQPYRDDTDLLLNLVQSVPYDETSCGRSAYARGSNQQVISFSYYQSKQESVRQYLAGVQDNLDLMKQLFPGFVMRLYYEADDEVTASLHQIASSSDHLMDLCPAQLNPRFGNMTEIYAMLWRFLPAVDPQVKVFLVRDLDSRLSVREKDAVLQFLDSDKKIHVMRDNPGHTAFIMGGMWGAKLTNKTRPKFQESFNKVLKDPSAYTDRFRGGWDQILLQRYVWPWGKRLVYAHDSYTCKKFSGTHAFPTQRLKGVGNYVGSVVSLNATVNNVCPYKCRPPNHKDWKFC